MNDGEKEFYEALRKMRAHKEHLGFDDFVPGYTATVEIEKVFKKKNVPSFKGTIQPEVIFLRFKGKDKILWITETKLKTLGSLLGKDWNAWAGKKISIFADPDVKRGKYTVGGLVIKAAE